MSQAIFSSEPEAKTTGQFFPPKVFAQPIRLAFKHPEDKTQSFWIEVRSLDGLRKLFERVDSGELEELGRFASVEMQLWGHLSEHSGFLRTQSNTSTLNAGIAPLGEGIAPLAEDLSDLFGGNDMAALSVLGNMKKTLKTPPYCNDVVIERPPVANEFVKPDGVNFTEKGENILLGLVHGNNADFPNRNPEGCEEAVAFRRESENAVEIFKYQTPNATPEELEAEETERVDCLVNGQDGGLEKNARPLEGEIKVGPEIAKIGVLVAAVGRGLDVEATEADKAIHEEADAALLILEAMIQIDAEGLEAVKAKASGILEQYGTSMDEIKDLSERARESSKLREGRWRGVKSKLSPVDAERNLKENVRRLMREITEFDLASLVAQSELPPMTPAEKEAHQMRADLALAEAEALDRTFYPEGENPYDKARAAAVARNLKFVKEPEQTYDGDHYKKRQVTPASDVPNDQDERAKWLAEQQRGPASMDTYREDAQRKQFLVDGRPVHNATENAKQNKADYERKMANFTDVPVDMDEIRRLAGLDKPKSNDQDPDKK